MAGNETAAGSRTFTYDLANRLKTTTSGSTTTTYSYDGDHDSPLALGAIDAWVTFFARACSRSVRDAGIFEQRVRELQTQWRERIPDGRDASVDQLIETLPGTAIVTIGSASRLLGRSFTVAKAAIEQLVRAKVLRKVNVGRENLAYEATEIVDAFTSSLSPRSHRAEPRRPTATKTPPG